jgi:hypothetical protein
MEDIEYTTCVPFAVIVANEPIDEKKKSRREQAGVPALRNSPWVMQEEGEA